MTYDPYNIEQLESQKQDIEVQLKVAKLHDELHHDNPMYMIANILHKMDCRHNHTDGCGWFYFDWDKPHPNGGLEYSRKEYLDKAEAYVNVNIGATTDEIVTQLMKLCAILRRY